MTKQTVITVEKTGATPREAYAAAVEELGQHLRDDVDYQFQGFVGRHAKTKAPLARVVAYRWEDA